MFYLCMLIDTQMKMGGKTLKNIISILVTIHLGQHFCAVRGVCQEWFGLVIKQFVTSEAAILAW